MVIYNFRFEEGVKPLPYYPLCNYFPEIVTPFTLIHGKSQYPEFSRSRLMAIVFRSMSARFPAIITSLRGLVTRPFSIKKLFLATPLRSPDGLGSPPENLPIRIP